MAEPLASPVLAQEVKAELDSFVVTIELTLISIIQGVALAVLAASSLEPVVTLRLEFAHNFLYFGATLIEALALSQVTHPARWFALNTGYAAAIWLLYWTDLRMIARHAEGLEGPAARRLFEAVRRDQEQNVRLVMPLAVAFHLAAALLVVRWPEVFITGKWHVALGLIQVGVGTWYLRQGLPLLAGRDSLIYQRYLERRVGAARPA